MTLEELRAQIDATDAQLVTLLAQRARLVSEAWRQKTEAQQELVDQTREEAVLALVDRLGEKLGLDSADVRRIWREILRVQLRETPET